MVGDYISREAAIKALQPTHAPAINEVLASVLRRVPAADVVERPKWIPVTERLPEVKQEVLCACRAGIFEVLKYVNGINGPWYKDSRHVYMSGFVTHWMPLPEPPREGV